MAGREHGGGGRQGNERLTYHLDRPVLSFSEADCTGWSENQARSGAGAIGF